MRRRNGRQPVKSRRHRTIKSKARTAPSRLTSADWQEQINRLTSEGDEALEQLSGATEVLKVISSSPGDLEPVFDTILERATELCEATHGHVWRFDGEKLHAIAVRGDAAFVR